MKETLIALGLAWAVMTMVGCGATHYERSKSPQLDNLYGTSGSYRQQADSNRVVNQANGEISYRRGSYLYGPGGKSTFIAGRRVQDRE